MNYKTLCKTKTFLKVTKPDCYLLHKENTYNLILNQLFSWINIYFLQ